MKRLSTIFLSLLLLWGQVFVMAQPLRAPAPAKCRCCACRGADCCVTQSSADSAPRPMAPVQTGFPNLNSFSLTAFIAWTLPRGEAGFASAVNASPLPAARLPRFTWHCALLL